MALPTLRGTATLLTDPKSGETRTGGTWTSALIKFAVWTKTDDGWEEGDGALASAIAFNSDERTTADDFARFRKGDKVELYGPARPDVYNGKPQFRLTVEGCRKPEKTGNGRRTSTPGSPDPGVTERSPSRSGSREPKVERGPGVMAQLRSYRERQGASA